MKRILYSTLALFLVTVIAVCQSTSSFGNTRIEIIESDDTYKLNAEYDKSQTKEVQSYVDKSLANVTVDATMKLDGKPSFYIKAFPGKLKIVFNKKQHDGAAFEQMKKMYEGIKAIAKGGGNFSSTYTRL